MQRHGTNPSRFHRRATVLVPGLLLAMTGCGELVVRPDRPAATDFATPAAAQGNAPAPSPTPAFYRMIAGGDVLPGGWLDAYQHRYGYDYPYRSLAPHLQQADLALVNLECPLSRRGCANEKKTFTFRADPEAATALRAAGVNAVCLGNNHVMDYGPEALEDTLEVLDAQDIARCGAGRNAEESRKPAFVTTSSGFRFAILSYSLTYPASFWAGPARAGTAFGRRSWIEADVASAAAQAEAVVVCFHWGGELVQEPRPYQLQLARLAVAAGADAVVGSHPHILQGFEWYRGSLIAYSLGNLVFGGGRSRKAVRSALLRVTFDPEGNVTSADILPLNVDNRETEFVPRPLWGAQAEEVIKQAESLSARWETTFHHIDDGWWRSKNPMLSSANEKSVTGEIRNEETGNPTSVKP